MALLDSLRQFLSLQPMQERSIDTFDTTTDLATQLAAIHGTARPWRLPTIKEALGVPAIQRAVTLIANTTGSLALQGYRYGVLMPETPRVVVRPDPFTTPRDFYRDAAYCMATRGETIWWIAARDTDGTASSLIVVPPAELSVEDNPRNRLFPRYAWGTIKGTRYSPANPTGDFVHVTYLKEPMTLRGVGPLQLAQAAASVSVEAQEWAANFYAGGGYPSIELHSEVEMDGEESAALKAQWIGNPSNMPFVTTGSITTKEIGANPQGAAMLDSREYQNGDAARMFGIPGNLLEYSAPGSSLTYQNLAEVWTQFLRGCLAPNYLEPIEQALTDLLPRSTVIRFYVDGLMRADIKTRFEVYASGITSGVLTAEEAMKREGILPGDIENAAVPAAPPQAVPAPLQNRSFGPVRCDGTRVLHNRVGPCGKLLAEMGPFYGTCPRCRKVYAEPAPVVSEDNMLLRALTAAVVSMSEREPAPQVPSVVNVTVPEGHQPDVNVNFERGAVEVSAPVTIEPAVVNVTTPEVRNEITVEPAGVTVEPTPVEIRNEITVEPAPVTNEITVEPTPVEITNEVSVEPTPVEVRNEFTGGEVHVRAEMPADMTMQITAMPPQSMEITALPPQKRRVTKRDSQGRIAEVSEESEP